MKTALIVAVIAFTSGCSQVTTEDNPEGESRARAATRDTVETVTGAKSIKAGRRTQDKIRKIGASHSSDLEDVGVESK
jgi:uncharacterized protein YceK